MAQNLQLLKRRIKTSKNIAQIAKAMEMISASKIKKAQDAVSSNKPYAKHIEDLTKKISGNIDREKFSHPYTEKREGKTLWIIFTPDKGLCGSLNTNLSKNILSNNETNPLVVIFGKKGSQFVKKIGIVPIAEFDFGTSLPTYRRVYEVVEIINEYFLAKKAARVVITYPEFTSMFLQEPTSDTLLPIELDVTTDEKIPYLFEPRASELMSELLPYYLETKIFSILLEAHTSEQAARMMAMQNAKINALDIAESLTLLYNKSRQEKITSEILDLNSSSL